MKARDLVLGQDYEYVAVANGQPLRITYVGPADRKGYATFSRVGHIMDDDLNVIGARAYTSAYPMRNVIRPWSEVERERTEISERESRENAEMERAYSKQFGNIPEAVINLLDLLGAKDAEARPGAALGEVFCCLDFDIDVQRALTLYRVTARLTPDLLDHLDLDAELARPLVLQEENHSAFREREWGLFEFRLKLSADELYRWHGVAGEAWRVSTPF